MATSDHGLLLGLTDNDHPQYADGWEDWIYVEGGIGFKNSWVANGGSFWEQPSYRKHSDGMVQVRGLSKDGSMGSSMFALPTGYRPPDSLMFVQVDGAGTGIRGDCDPDGDVFAGAGGDNTFVAVALLFDSTGGS